ncbi:MAG: LysR family transcriptional regulator [Pseudomonadales bacterium]|nr:LysR family transcriptional regulator [Pseudomonadales bacterium]
MDKLNLIRLFLTVVDRGSFAAAAAVQGLSPSTVSKAIARLEEDLRLLLFHRTTRQLTLTVAGQNYAKTVRQLVSELDQCEKDLGRQNDSPSGRLRVNVPVSYGRRYVVPMLSGFRERYPDIELDVRFDDSYVDMIEQGIDVSIRSGTLAESGLIARQLSPVDFLICGSPAYLGATRTIAATDFGRHPWVRFRFQQTGRVLPVMVPGDEESLMLDPGRQFVVDDGEALAELCAAGAGLTQVPHFIARDWLAGGQIVPVAPAYRPPGFGVWVVYPEREYLPQKIRVFIEWLEKYVREQGESAYHTWAENLGAGTGPRYDG